MYVPKDFRIPLPLAKAVMQRYSFATLVTAESGAPVGTHLPILHRPTEGSLGKLAGHVAKANLQWKSFTESHQVLVLFQGPHAYVSPAWYKVQPSVPTWNYVSVHATGIARPVGDENVTRRILEDLVATYDQAWKMSTLTDDYIQGMMRQIVAFEIELTSIEGKFKLNQNRSREDRVAVRQELEKSDDPVARELAGYMLALEEGRPPV
jgi:transcriptional regulator